MRIQHFETRFIRDYRRSLVKLLIGFLALLFCCPAPTWALYSSEPLATLKELAYTDPTAAIREAENLHQMATLRNSLPEQANALLILATAYSNLGDMEALEDVARQGEELSDQVGDNVLLCQFLAQKAYAMSRNGMTGEISHLLDNALVLAKASGDDRPLLQVLLTKGSLHAFVLDSEPALKAFGEARAIAIAQGDNAMLAEIYAEQGHLYLNLRRYEEAMDSYRQSQSLRPPRTPSEQMTNEINFGYVLTKLGKYEEAETHLRNALATSSTAADSYLNAYANLRLGQLLRVELKTPEALVSLKLALSEFERQHDQTMQMQSRLEIAQALLDQNQITDAETQVAQAATLFSGLLPQDTDQETIQRLVSLFRSTHQHEQAVNFVLEARSKLEALHQARLQQLEIRLQRQSLREQGELLLQIDQLQQQIEGQDNTLRLLWITLGAMSFLSLLLAFLLWLHRKS